MKVELNLHWKLGMGAVKSFDGSIFTLLDGIQDSGSLQEACRRADLSYRHAWGLMNEWAETLGRPLADLKRGRGSQLTALGSALLATRQQVESRYANEFARLATELAQKFSTPAIARRWRVFASHDIALLKAREAISRACGVEFEIEIHGSQDCLEALARRRCNIAGFHLTGDESPEIWLHNALGRMPDQPVRLVELVRREQGLLLRPGLETKIRSIADVARSGLRFINRQRGSGTRTLFDRLLKNENLRTTDIRGYHDEEFTHLAVAATIAGGGADAALGIHAAAAQFGLPFVPLEHETYYLACREDRPDVEHISRLVEFLRSLEFRAVCAALPGYDATHSGNDSLIKPRTRRRARAVTQSSSESRHRSPR
jgi:putative molybdopterin biosynthesis protein